jgi:hypothetical protein
MLAIRWAQGRLDELWPEIADHSERFPWIPRWREPFAAAELADEAMARHELERQGIHEFADVHRDGLWMLHLCSLAEASVLVGDEQRAVRLYELLLPYADDQAVSYTQQPFGPVAFRLEKLAALLGRWKDEQLEIPALFARPAPASVTEDEASAPATFRREGEFWTIAYDGQTVRLRDVKGLRYIASLLASPGRELPVLELTAAGGGNGRGRAADEGLTRAWGSNGDAVLDEQAKAA